MRERLKERVEKEHGVKLSFMPFFVKAACIALEQFPTVNALVDGDTIVYRHYVNMGIAVAVDAGLVVPNIKDADRKSMLDVSREIARAGEARARHEAHDGRPHRRHVHDHQRRRVRLAHLDADHQLPAGRRFSVCTRRRIAPWRSAGKVEIRPMMYVALSYDHRIIEGQQAVQFLVRVKELMEDPASMLVN